MKGAACQKSLADPCAAVGHEDSRRQGDRTVGWRRDGQRGALARGGAGWQGIKLSVGSAQAGCDFDAHKLDEGFATFKAQDLQNLGIGEAVARIERAEFDFNLMVSQLPNVEEKLAREGQERILALSREKYARPRAEVEAELAKESTVAKLESKVREPRPESTREEELGGATVKPESEAAQLEPETKTVRSELEPEDVAKAPRRRASPRAVPPEMPTLGRGGKQHKYLQEFIKRAGEDKGYLVTIEKQVLAGQGSVDVALERDGNSIACEISVTTTVEHEIGNIEKCLAAGFEHVVLVASDNKTLTSARQLASTAIAERDLGRVQFLMPNEFAVFKLPISS